MKHLFLIMLSLPAINTQAAASLPIGAASAKCCMAGPDTCISPEDADCFTFQWPLVKTHELCHVASENPVAEAAVSCLSNNAMTGYSHDIAFASDALPPGGVYLASKVMLSGPYVEATGLMRDDLRINNVIPTNEPYTTLPYLHPIIGVPCGETVSASVLIVEGNDAIVDWILIELRSASDVSFLVATKRALVQRDGDIVSNTDGTSPVFFPGIPIASYYVSVKHRNHLGVMTDGPVPLQASVNAVVDFTTNNVWIMPGQLNAPRRMYGSVAALWAGDANRNKNTKYNGLNNDKDAVLNAVGILSPNNVIYSVYRPEDLNMDAKIKYNNSNNDRNVIANTVGTSSLNNVVTQHTPN